MKNVHLRREPGRQIPILSGGTSHIPHICECLPNLQLSRNVVKLLRGFAFCLANIPFFFRFLRRWEEVLSKNTTLLLESCTASLVQNKVSENAINISWEFTSWYQWGVHNAQQKYYPKVIVPFVFHD